MYWVQRRYGALNDAINVTTNYSCQLGQLTPCNGLGIKEIPSQTMGSDSTVVDTNKATNYGNALWSDDVVLMEENSRANYDDNSTTQRENAHKKQAYLSKVHATVNPSSNTMVEGSLDSNDQQAKLQDGVDKLASKEGGKIGGTSVAVSPKKLGNRTVNPSSTGKVFSNVEGVPMDVTGGDQIENISVEVLYDTMRSDHQTVGVKAMDLN